MPQTSINIILKMHVTYITEKGLSSWICEISTVHKLKYSESSCKMG